MNVTDTANNFVGSSFDALGRMTRQSSPFGNIDMAYDVAGRLTRVTHADGLFFDYVHDTANLTAIRENGATTNLVKYEYDDLGRRTRIVRRNGATSVTWTNMAYDPVGRLKSYSQDLGGTPNDLNVAGPGNGGTSITYNPASQLTGITRSNPTDLYAWTGHYNINRAYGTNGLNQLTSAGATALGYDGRGNLTSSGSDSYAYTSENRLASGPGGVTLSYDPTGRLSRVTKQQGTSTLTDTRFEYLGPRLISERDASGNIIRRYVHGPGDDEPVVWYEGATLAPAGRRFLHTDERGSVIAVTDFTGNSLATIKYDEYGIPQANVALAPGSAGRFLYTGQAWIPELGLYYYKARFYSPLLGRFMQTDPIGYEDGINWYNYVGGDPINRRDPSGRVKCEGDARCDDVHKAAEKAKATAEGASAKLNDLAAAVEGGGELTEAQEADKVAYEKKFGSGSATAKNLSKTAGKFDKIASKIGNRGEGASVRFGTLSPKTIAEASGSKMTFNNGFFNSDGNYTGNLSLNFVVLHEGGHMAGLSDLRVDDLKALGLGRPGRKGQVAYGVGATEWLAQNDPHKAARNNDNYQCFANPDCGGP